MIADAVAVAKLLRPKGQPVKVSVAWLVRNATETMALGRKAEARAVLQRFVATNKGSQRALEDAKKKLDDLGA